MKLLVDQNLSRQLVERLRDHFPDSVHVASLGLDTAADKDVWDHAGEHGYTIVSKDSDFRQLAFLYGPPPKVIWLRVGNVTTATAFEVLVNHYEVIEASENAAEEALLVLPGLPRD